MGRTGNAFLRPLFIVTCAGFFLGGGTEAFSNQNCRKLESLARQYAGVKLTAEQKQLKRRLVAWYNGNCKTTRSAQANR
jgi:hypothetical protein